MNRLNLNCSAALADAGALALSVSLACAETVPVKKTVVQSKIELPTYSYKITRPTASALLDDDVALLALAEAQRKEAEATLANFEIADKATLRDLYAAIRGANLIGADAGVPRRAGRSSRRRDSQLKQ